MGFSQNITEKQLQDCLLSALTVMAPGMGGDHVNVSHSTVMEMMYSISTEVQNSRILEFWNIN